MVLSLCHLQHGICLVYGPPLDQALSDIDKITLFYNTFRDVGRVIYNEYAGDGWTKDLEYYEESQGCCDEQAYFSWLFL